MQRTTSSGRPLLTQLAGMRAAASFWLVLRHFLGEPRVPGGALINRGVVPTGTFILLSGFVTHYAYHGKPYDTRTQVLRYYARRFGAILLSYYASTLLMLLFAILACQSGSCIGGTEALGPFSMVLKTVLTFLMLQSFDPLEPSFPNGPAWTISTMGLMWLLYPQLLAWLRLPLARRPFLVAACAALCCQLPMVLCFFAGAVAPQSGLRAYFISETQSLIGYHFPPLRVADFVLGMALAQALADGRAAQDNMRWALVADLTLLAVWGVCGWVPWDARSADFPVSGYEPLFIGGMQPFIGLFMFASSCAGASRSAFVRVLRHPVLQSLGEYSFQVYLWHWPIGLIFKGAEIGMTGNTGHGLSGAFFIPYLLAAYFASAAISIHAEEPFRKWLRAHVDAWATSREGASAAKRESSTVGPSGHVDGTGADTSVQSGAGAAPVSKPLLGSDIERSDGAPAAAVTGGAAEVTTHTEP